MSKGGGKQTTTQENKIPKWVEDAAKGNYQYAQDVAAGYKPVHMQAPAGFSQDQITAQQMVRDMAASGGGPSAATQGLIDKISNFEYTPQTYEAAKMSDNPLFKQLLARMDSGGPAMPQFTNVDVGSFGASAQQVGEIDAIEAERAAAAAMNRGDIRDVTTQMTPEALQEYLAAFDPSYDQAVMSAAANDLERARQTTQQGNASAAAAAGAFGGSRHGLVEAETNRGFADTLARTSADLRLKGLDRALGSMQSDFTRRMQADALNQGQDWNVAQGNAGFTQQANLANAAQALEAARANQSTELARQSTNASLGTQASIASGQMAAQAAMANASARNSFLLAQYNAAAQRAMNGDTLTYNVLSGDTTSENAARSFGATAGNRATEFEADLWNAALPNLGNIDNDVWRRNAANVGLLADSGAAQQALDQAGLDVDFFNQTADQQAPLQQLQILQGALGNTPYSTTSTSTTEYQKSLMDRILGLGGAAMQAASIFTKSDKRLKRNIQPIHSPLSKLRKLNGVSYNWRENGAKDLGLVAQDVQRAMPEAVQMRGGAMHYSMPAVIGLLTSAVNELDRRTR